MSDVKLGVLATLRGIALDLDTVAALEATGCDSLWSAGHIAAGETPEAVTALAALASMSRRVTVGTAALVLPFYQPIVLAKQIAEIDRISAGRVMLGIGVGADEPELAALGVPMSERGRRTDETIDVLRALWAGGPVTRSGPWWPLREVEIAPPPAQRGGPPLIVAGRAEGAMRRAAARGDGWMPFMTSADGYARSVAAIGDQAAAAGRALDGFEWACFIYARADAEADRAWERALDHVATDIPLERSKLAGMLTKVAAVGTPDQVTARLQAYVDAGARHFVVSCCPHGDLVEQTALLAGEIVPRLTVPTATATAQ